MTQNDIAEDQTNKNGAASPLSSDQLHALIMKSLDDDKGQDIVSIALAGKSSIADHMVVASGTSSRQVAGMAQKLVERVKKQGGSCRLEGMTNADWVLIDTGDVIVHLFRPEVRSFYNLERMWSFDEESGHMIDSSSNDLSGE